MRKITIKGRILGVFLAAAAALATTFVVVSCAGMGRASDEITITVLATTDVHGKIFPWEYATGSAQEWGLAKIATLVELERGRRGANVILIDNGDTIESNMVQIFNGDPVHPMIMAMNVIGYDLWNLGNHEFNFGLDVLGRAIAGFNGPVISANIVRDSGGYYTQPYAIVEIGGARVGILGIIAPHVPRWEAGTPEHFAGLSFLDPLEVTRRYVSVLRETENVDVLIGAFHIGAGSDNYDPALVDSARVIAESVPGIDAMILGHSHATLGRADGQVFFGDTIVLQPAYDGLFLGKLTIELRRGADGRLVISDRATDLIPASGVAPSPRLLSQMQYVDDRSRAEAEKVVGRATGDFVPRDSVAGIPEAQVRSTALVDLINRVQMHYTGADVSAAALFDNRSNLREGELRFMDVALIYRYSNTLQAHRISGENLRKYMEWSASFYNTQAEGDVTISFNENIRGYNYDMFLGVDYQIDIRRPAGSRIVNLTYKGAPVRDGDVFILAVNNYRAGTLQSLGLLPADLSESMVFDSLATAVPEMQRLIQQYLSQELGGVASPSASNNWRIVGNDYSGLSGAREALALVNSGVIDLPRSSDGRTANVRSVNVLESASAEYIAELAAAAKIDPGLISGAGITRGELYRQVHALLGL
ncbi:MAG: 5'-nucleotidase C-terminal domain-containing protein [Treponema sp.]|nr:5'-nucleotidase C-terminal domain-containing protein [Treponema sp.]